MIWICDYQHPKRVKAKYEITGYADNKVPLTACNKHLAMGVREAVLRNSATENRVIVRCYEEGNV